MTIPVALSSLGYAGNLNRVDDEPIAPVPNSVEFTSSHIRTTLQNWISTETPSEIALTLGNHIIDDLLFSCHFPAIEERRVAYSDRSRSIQAWKELAQSRKLEFYQESIILELSELMERLRPGGILILRHYPSTIALMLRDRARVHAEMSTFRKLRQEISKSDRYLISTIDEREINTAPGSKWPRSFLVLSNEKKTSA